MLAKVPSEAALVVKSQMAGDLQQAVLPVSQEIAGGAYAEFHPVVFDVRADRLFEHALKLANREVAGVGKQFNSRELLQVRFQGTNRWLQTKAFWFASGITRSGLERSHDTDHFALRILDGVLAGPVPVGETDMVDADFNSRW